jgi:hypothetical protein
MKLKHYITLALGAAATVAPQFVTAVGPDYRDAATALAALITAFYHLTQTPPTATPEGGK